MHFFDLSFLSSTEGRKEKMNNGEGHYEIGPGILVMPIILARQRQRQKNDEFKASETVFFFNKKKDFFFSHPSYQTSESPVSGLSSQVLALQHTCN